MSLLEKLPPKDPYRDRILAMVGSFDPPTKGHLAMVRAAQRKLFWKGIKVWMVVLLPVASDGYAFKVLTADEHRLEMTKLMLLPIPMYDVADFEITEFKTWHPTVEVLNELQKRWPDCGVSYVCGSDHLNSMVDWVNPEHPREIADRFQMVVVERPGAPIDQTVVEKIGATGKYISVPYMPDESFLAQTTGWYGNPISSTLVRERIFRGEEWRNLVSPRVADYIEEHRLYPVADPVTSPEEEIPEDPEKVTG